METLFPFYFPYGFWGQINMETTKSTSFNLNVEGGRVLLGFVSLKRSFSKKYIVQHKLRCMRCSCTSMLCTAVTSQPTPCSCCRYVLAHVYKKVSVCPDPLTKSALSDYTVPIESYPIPGWKPHLKNLLQLLMASLFSSQHPSNYHLATRRTRIKIFSHLRHCFLYFWLNMCTLVFWNCS